jgi:hypothetical protein
MRIVTRSGIGPDAGTIKQANTRRSAIQIVELEFVFPPESPNKTLPGHLAPAREVVPQTRSA